MKLARIEAVPKRVALIRLADGRFAARPGIDINLLENRGWLHLHVGYNIDDNVLLIVEQTTDAVIFIGLTNHDIFRERPAGRSFVRSFVREARRPDRQGQAPK